MRVAVSWSGGKDSALALDRIIRQGTHEVVGLLTNVSTATRRVTMHGVRRALIHAQARALGMPLWEISLGEATMAAFEEATLRMWHRLADEHGVEGIVHGDIFLEDVRTYRDQLLQRAGLHGIYPLWGYDTHRLLEEFWRTGHRTVICAADAANARLVGRELDHRTRARLAPGTDPCGENGEFHTFCFQSPHFRHSVPFRRGHPHLEVYRHRHQEHRFYYVDLLPPPNP